MKRLTSNSYSGPQGVVSLFKNETDSPAIINDYYTVRLSCNNRRIKKKKKKAYDNCFCTNFNDFPQEKGIHTANVVDRLITNIP